jgi:hypothetical protein
MEEVPFSEKSVNLYRTAWRHILEYITFHGFKIIFINKGCVNALKYITCLKNIVTYRPTARQQLVYTALANTQQWELCSLWTVLQLVAE